MAHNVDCARTDRCHRFSPSSLFSVVVAMPKTRSASYGSYFIWPCPAMDDMGKKKGKRVEHAHNATSATGSADGCQRARPRMGASRGKRERACKKREREMERMNWRALAAAASPSRVARGVLRRPCWNCCLSWRADGRCGEKPKQRRSCLLYGAAAPKSAQSHAATRLVPIGPLLVLFFPLFLLVVRVSVGRTVCLALAAACAVALSRVPFPPFKKSPQACTIFSDFFVPFPCCCAAFWHGRLCIGRNHKGKKASPNRERRRALVLGTRQNTHTEKKGCAHNHWAFP